MNKLDTLNLTRVIGTENNQETLFISILGNNISESSLSLYLASIKSHFSTGATIPIQITTNPMGALSDYLYEKEGEIVDFLLSDEISSFLNDGGVLLVEDECFDELKYSFFKEDDKFLGINKDGKIVYF